MNYRSVRGWIVLALVAGMLGLQMYSTSEWTIAWPPLVVVIAAAAMFARELRAYPWSGLRKAAFWEAAFFALTQGILAQAAGIVVVQYGLGVKAPPVGLVLTPMLILSAVLFSAILEELVFRKLIFGTLQKRTGFWAAAVVGSALFALAHYNYSAALGYFLLGLVWSRAYRKSGDLGVVVAAHIAFNAIAFLSMSLRG